MFLNKFNIMLLKKKKSRIYIQRKLYGERRGYSNPFKLFDRLISRKNYQFALLKITEEKVAFKKLNNYLIKTRSLLLNQPRSLELNPSQNTPFLLLNETFSQNTKGNFVKIDYKSLVLGNSVKATKFKLLDYVLGIYSYDHLQVNKYKVEDVIFKPIVYNNSIPFCDLLDLVQKNYKINLGEAQYISEFRQCKEAMNSVKVHLNFDTIPYVEYQYKVRPLTMVISYKEDKNNILSIEDELYLYCVLDQELFDLKHNINKVSGQNYLNKLDIIYFWYCYKYISQIKSIACSKILPKNLIAMLLYYLSYKQLLSKDYTVSYYKLLDLIYVKTPKLILYLTRIQEYMYNKFKLEDLSVYPSKLIIFSEGKTENENKYLGDFLLIDTKVTLQKSSLYFINILEITVNEFFEGIVNDISLLNYERTAFRGLYQSLLIDVVTKSNIINLEVNNQIFKVSLLYKIYIIVRNFLIEFNKNYLRKKFELFDSSFRIILCVALEAAVLKKWYFANGYGVPEFSSYIFYYVDGDFIQDLMHCLLIDKNLESCVVLKAMLQTERLVITVITI